MKEMSTEQEAGITDSFIVQDLALKHWTFIELPADLEQKLSNFQQHVIRSAGRGGGGGNETTRLC